MIRRQYAEEVTSYMKGGSDLDKNFRHNVKTSGFRLLDLPEAGIRDALVVKVKEDKQVRYNLLLIIANLFRFQVLIMVCFDSLSPTQY